MDCGLDMSNDDTLQHWGIKGQKWGVRRYQNKDGTLTPRGQKRYNKEMEKLKAETAKVKAEEKVAANRKKTQAKIDKLEAKKQDLEERKKALKEDASGKKNDDSNSGETEEQRRERLLKSVDAKELYANKDLLTSAELNERINRIDLETRLQSKIASEPQRAEVDRMVEAKNKIDKITNLYKSADNAYSTVANSAIGKTLAKKLGIEPPKKEFDINEFWKNRHKKSAQEMVEANRWLTAEESIKKKKDAREQEAKDKKAAKEAQKQVDDYNERWRKDGADDRPSDSTYSKTGKDLNNSRDTVKTFRLEDKSRNNTSDDSNVRNERRRDDDDIITDNYRDITNETTSRGESYVSSNLPAIRSSNVPATYSDTGRNYVDNLFNRD